MTVQRTSQPKNQNGPLGIFLVLPICQSGPECGCCCCGCFVRTWWQKQIKRRTQSSTVGFLWVERCFRFTPDCLSFHWQIAAPSHNLTRAWCRCLAVSLGSLLTNRRKKMSRIIMVWYDMIILKYELVIYFYKLTFIFMCICFSFVFIFFSYLTAFRIIFSLSVSWILLLQRFPP